MKERIGPAKAIKRYCIDVCCAGDRECVRDCKGNSEEVGVNCPLWPFRNGRGLARVRVEKHAPKSAPTGKK